MQRAISYIYEMQQQLLLSGSFALGAAAVQKQGQVQRMAHSGAA
jgi:hypothetical protein